MSQLPELLTVLTEELVQLRDASLAAAAPDGMIYELTEDTNFIYLEAELGCESSTEIDISIHETRAFIRIERSLLEAGSGDDLEADFKRKFGWVDFTELGATIRASLEANGIWTCTAAPEVAELLNRDCSPAGDRLDQDSACALLVKAAERLNGLAWVAPGRLPSE
jgi:hypothetical protein